MYIFLLTVSFLCSEQTADMAAKSGCNNISDTALMEQQSNVARTDVRGYFATEAGCLRAAREEESVERKLDAHLVQLDSNPQFHSSVFHTAHVACKAVSLNP